MSRSRASGRSQSAAYDACVVKQEYVRVFSQPQCSHHCAGVFLSGVHTDKAGWVW